MTRKLLTAATLLLFVAACVQAPASRGPRSLGEVAALAPEGPRRASLHLTGQAAAALDRGEVETAHDLAMRALRVDESNPYAYYVMTRIEFAEGDRAAAQRDLGQAIGLLEVQEPDNQRWRGRMMRLRADLLADEGRTSEADELRRQADRLDPVAPGSGSGAPRGLVIESPR